jgi:hypothetical protein
MVLVSNAYPLSLILHSLLTGQQARVREKRFGISEIKTAFRLLFLQLSAPGSGLTILSFLTEPQIVP